MAREKKHSKAEWSWIMYDWANSVYATIVMAAVLPTYFAALDPNADAWWGYGTSIATFVIAILAPVLGAVADYHGMKKRLFSFFLILGVVFTSAMALTDNWKLMLIGYILSYIGFAGSNLFYDSFLTDVTTPERMDSISARGYAMGYIGGSTIPFLVSIAMILFLGNSVLAIKLSLVLTSLWWAVFTIPFLKNVNQTHDLGEAPKAIVGQAFRNVGKTFKSIMTNKALLFFILAYFFYIDGVGTVIHMSTVYGSTLGLNTVSMIIALLVTQLVAAPCAVLFAKFSEKIGSIKMLGVSIGIYFLICLVGFYMGFSLEPSQFAAEKAFTEAYVSVVPDADDPASANYATYLDAFNCISSKTRTEEMQAVLAADTTLDAATKTALTEKMTTVMDGITNEGTHDAALKRSNTLFWMMAVLVGTCQGGIQALSRSYFGKLVPAEKSNEYFGFFDIFGKFAAVIGPALYAFVKTTTGRPSFGILGLMILFALGGVMLLCGRKYFHAAEHT